MDIKLLLRDHLPKPVLFTFILLISCFSHASDYYWIGGSGSWDDLSHWSTTSGGSPNVITTPLTTDNVYFNSGSGFSPGNANVTLSGIVKNAGDISINVPGITVAWIGNAAFQFYGDMTLSTSVNLAGFLGEIRSYIEEPVALGDKIISTGNNIFYSRFVFMPNLSGNTIINGVFRNRGVTYVNLFQPSNKVTFTQSAYFTTSLEVEKGEVHLNNGFFTQYLIFDIWIRPNGKVYSSGDGNANIIANSGGLYLSEDNNPHTYDLYAVINYENYPASAATPSVSNISNCTINITNSWRYGAGVSSNYAVSSPNSLIRFLSNGVQFVPFDYTYNNIQIDESSLVTFFDFNLRELTNPSAPVFNNVTINRNTTFRYTVNVITNLARPTFNTLTLTAGHTYKIRSYSTANIDQLETVGSIVRFRIAAGGTVNQLGDCEHPIILDKIAMEFMGAATVNSSYIKGVNIMATGPSAPYNAGTGSRAISGTNAGWTVSGGIPRVLVWVGPIPAVTTNETTYGKWSSSQNWRDVAIDGYGPGTVLSSVPLPGTPACPPTELDSVIFPDQSYVKIDDISIAYTQGMLWVNRGRIYASAEREMEIWGSLNFSYAMTNSFQGTYYFRSNRPYRCHIFTRKKPFLSGVIFDADAASGSWLLRDTLYAPYKDTKTSLMLNTINDYLQCSILIKNGDLHTGYLPCVNGHGSAIEAFGINCGNGTLNLYDSDVRIYGNGGRTLQVENAFKMRAGTSNIIIEAIYGGGGASAALFGKGKKYYDITLQRSVSSPSATDPSHSIYLELDTITRLTVQPYTKSYFYATLGTSAGLIRKMDILSQERCIFWHSSNAISNSFFFTIDSLYMKGFVQYNAQVRVRSYLKMDPGHTSFFSNASPAINLVLNSATASSPNVFEPCIGGNYSYPSGATVSINGSCTNPIIIENGIINALSSSPVTANYVNIVNNTITGAGGTYSNANLSGTTTGWTGTASNPRVLRWKDVSNTAGNSGNWNDPNYWEQVFPVYAAAPQCPPTKIDTAIFDNQSFSQTNQKVNVSANAEVGSMYWRNITAYATPPQFVGTSTTQFRMYGSLEFHSNMRNDFMGGFHFKGIPTVQHPIFRITMAQKSFRKYTYFEGEADNTEWQLMDSVSYDLYAPGVPNLIHYRGRLITNGKPIYMTASGMEFASTASRYFNFANSRIYIGYGNFNVLNPATLTVASTNSHIRINTGTFAGGGKVYNDVTAGGNNVFFNITAGDVFRTVTLNNNYTEFTGGTGMVARRIRNNTSVLHHFTPYAIVDTMQLFAPINTIYSSNKFRKSFEVNAGSTLILGDSSVQWFDNKCNVDLIGLPGVPIQLYSKTAGLRTFLRKDSATVCADYINMRDIWGIGNGNNVGICSSFANPSVNSNCPPFVAHPYLVSTCDTITDFNSACGPWEPLNPLRGRASFTAGSFANNQGNNRGWDYRAYPPVPSIALSSPSSTICEGQSISLTISGVAKLPFTFYYSDSDGNDYFVTINNAGQLAAYNASTNAFTWTTTITPPHTMTYTPGTITIERCFNNTSPAGTGTATIQVNPIPQVTNGGLTQEICSGTSGTFTPATTVAATVNWTSPSVGGIGGHATSGSGTITETLTNSGSSPSTLTYTLTPTAAGCTGTPVTHAITVNPLPALTAGPAQNLDCNTPNATVTVSTPMAGVNYSWSGPSVTGGATSNAATVDAAGTYTVTVTNPVTTCSSSANVAVNFIPDTQAPSITCPVNIVTTTTTGNCSASVNVPNAITSDNCGVTRLSWVMTGATTGSSPVTGINNVGTQTFNTGTTFIQYTIGDAAGNTTTCNFNVFVGDNIAPTVTCPANIAANTSLSGCSASVVTPNPVTNDNCAVTRLTWSMTGATSGNSPATGINNLGTYTFNQGTTTVTYTVYDAAGNNSNCSFQVTVTDNIPPTVSCQANVITTTGAATCSASFTTTNPTISDNCGVTALTWSMTGATTANSPASGINNVGTYTFNQGTTTVTYTVSDAAGNTAQCSYTITVNDNIAPVINCPANSSVTTASGSCDASVTLSNPMISDNCSVSALVWTMSGATTGNSSATGINYVGTQTFNLGTTTVQYTATDAAGNSSNCSFTVTVTDNVAPVINCPANIAANTSSSSCDASVVTPNPTVSDNCSLTTLVWSMSGATNANSPATGINNIGTYTFNSGVTSVTYTATDAAGNSSNCSFNVTVSDATPPVAPVIDTVFGQCSAAATIPVTTDNCSGSVSGTTSDPLSYNSQGTFTINWTFTDGAGNVTNATQIVVVDNQLPPIAPVLPDVYAQCDTTVTAPVSTTNCSGPVTGTTTDPTTYSTQGTYVIVWLFDDGMGNVVTSNQNVIIDDTISPIVPVIADVSDECSVTLSAPTASDNCVGTVTGTTSDPTTYTTQGTFTVTWIFDDGHGNVDSTTQTVIIADTTDPVIGNCPADIASGTDPGQCTATVSWTPPTASDNCSGMTTTSTHSPGDVFPTGTTAVTYTFTDAGGNSVTCSFNVTVTENEAPVIAGCPSDITASNDSGTCDASVSWTVPTATDNCPGVTMTSTHNPGDVFPQGTTTVTYTATDAAGNTATCTFTVTVNDTEDPSITPLADLSVCEGGTANWSPAGTDNCSSVTFTSTPTSGQIFPVGTTQVIVTGTDAAGNSTTDTFNIVVNPMPALTLSMDNPDICIGDGMTLNVNNQSAASYSWTLDGNVVGSGSNYSVSETTPSTNGLYEVTVVEQNGCISYGELLIDLSPCDLIIPEALTPNGDGQNDLFAIKNLELYPNSSIQIVNRWGNVVFETNDYQNDWDGTSYSQLNIGGNQLPEGTFFYVLTIGGDPAEKLYGEVYTGYVYLKR